jgi:hypothetical protein
MEAFGHAMDYLSSNPIWIAAVILLVPTTLAAMAGPFVIRRFVPLERLRTNNEVAGFKFAVVGVVYAVLLAFAVIVVWERYNQAEADVAEEASAAITIFRLSHALDDQHGAAVRTATSAYLTNAIEQDWPGLQRGHVGPAAAQALSNVYSAVLKYHAVDVAEGLVVAEILRQVDAISKARRERIVTASGVVPDIIWVVLFGGALVTVAFTLFFATDSLLAQTIMTGALSLLVFGGLLTIVAIDHPFAGTEHIKPEALIAVLHDFGAQ